jgi:ABC-type Na+ efflux pump permease subunit
MRGAWFVARADLRRALRQKETWIWTFVMPIVFFYFFTLIQGGGGSQAKPKDSLTLLVPDGGGVLVDELERRLRELDYEVTRVAALDVAAAKPARVVEVPAGFSEAVLRGETREVRLVRQEGGNAAELDRFRVSRAAWGVLADLVANAARERESDVESFRELAAWPRAIAIDAKPAGERRKIPTGKDQSIPGTMVMFTLVLLLTSGAIGVVIERREGLLRRLASTPLTRGAVLAGKWLGTWMLGLVQIGYGALVGTLLFGLEWGPDAWAVAVVLVTWAGFVASLAMLASSFARTEGQVIGMGVLASNVLAALGGCWWPIEVTPRWMQDLATLLPTGAVMGALHRLMLFQTGPSGALAAVAYMVLGAAVLGWLAARRFRFD